MASNACPECSKEVGENDLSCLNCGFPLTFGRSARRPGGSNHAQASKSTSSGRSTPDGPHGVGGWLALLVAGMIFIGPILTILRMTADIRGLEVQSPILLLSPEWGWFKWMAWCFVGSIMLYGIVSGLLLIKDRKPSSVKNAIGYVWIAGPLGKVVLLIILPLLCFGPEICTTIDEIIPKIIISLGYASMWTLYFTKSQRVRNTYFTP